MKTLRKIKIIGSIDEDMYLNFTNELDVLEAESHKPIEIELSSGGGSAMDALAFYSRIVNSPCEIDIVAVGLVASAATLILIAGDRRFMDKDAWVMIHEDSDRVKGLVSDIEREAARLRMLEKQWAGIFARKCNGSVEFWEKTASTEKWLTSKECKDLGIIDEVF